MEPFERHFASKLIFLNWVKLAVKLPKFDRVPLTTVWTYGDGHKVDRQLGKRGGTLNANLKFLSKTGTGKLDHASDAELVSDIDTRGGMTFKVDWRDASLA